MLPQTKSPQEQTVAERLEAAFARFFEAVLIGEFARADLELDLIRDLGGHQDRRL